MFPMSREITWWGERGPDRETGQNPRARPGEPGAGRTATREREGGGARAVGSAHWSKRCVAWGRSTCPIQPVLWGRSMTVS
jgi:hypothetical protein